MGLSTTELVVILAVVVLLFGSGKISGLMGDLAKGLKVFKRTMNEPDSTAPTQVEGHSRTATAVDVRENS